MFTTSALIYLLHVVSMNNQSSDGLEPLQEFCLSCIHHHMIKNEIIKSLTNGIEKLSHVLWILKIQMLLEKLTWGHNYCAYIICRS